MITSRSCAVGIAAIKPDPFRWYDYSRYTFSLGLDLGEWAILSGHSASEYDAGSKSIVVKGGMGDQARTAYEKIGTILQAAGYGFADVVRVVEYVTVNGLGQHHEAEEARIQILGNDPVVNRVVVNRLLRPAALIEVEVTAGRGGSIPGVHYFPSLSSDIEGDLVVQTNQIYEKAGALLEAAGLSWRNVVKTVDHITPPALSDYKATARVRREFLGPVYPAATGIIVKRLPDPRAMIQVDFIASSEPPAAVNPGWDRYEKLTYNPAVRAGDILYMSGQAALDPLTERAAHAGDVVAQTEYTYNNILEVLGAAGLGPSNLVKTVEFVTAAGLERYRQTAEVRESLLGQPFPASTGVVCEGLLRPEFEIEVDPLAVFDR